MNAAEIVTSIAQRKHDDSDNLPARKLCGGCGTARGVRCGQNGLQLRGLGIYLEQGGGDSAGGAALLTFPTMVLSEV